MVEHPFTPNQTIRLPDLASARGLEGSHFRVEEVYRGGMGLCARIRHSGTNSVYALKAPDPSFIPDDRAWRRWQREMRAWLQLSAHAGVVPAYCISAVNEVPCVAARWMPGGNLRPRLATRSAAHFYQTALRIAHTLEWALSKHGVVHRDLKPENLLLDEDGRVFVADWGIAKLLDTPSKASTGHAADPVSHPVQLTSPGALLGTVLYAAPEQIVGRPGVDHRADIYGLGCVLFEWEAGSPPFPGSTTQEIAQGHLHVPPPRLGGLLGRTAFGAQAVIRRCLAKDPADRFQTYAELIAALRKRAETRRVEVVDSTPEQVYVLPPLGGSMIDAGLARAARSAAPQKDSKGTYVVAGLSNVEPYLREAEALVGLGEWQKASEILARFYIPEMPVDNAITALIALNYAFCLTKLGQAADAVEILDRFSATDHRPVEYYVNHSLACLHTGDAAKAEALATAGLALAPDDPDLLGNLVIAQRHQEKLPEAAETARRRLATGRTVHALEEAATVMSAVARELEDRDLPAAAAYYREALTMLREAKAMNPRFLTARVNLARTLFDVESVVEAMEEIDEIWNLRPHRDLGLVLAETAARALDHVGSHRECVEHCDRWLKEFPDNVALHRIRAETIVDGLCIGKERDGVRVVDRTSLSFFEKTVADAGLRQTSDVLYLARLREWMGDVPAAELLVEEARAERPEWWQPPLVAAGFQWRKGDIESCRQLLKLSAELAPWQSRPWGLLAYIMRSEGRNAEAASAATKEEQIKRQRDEILEGLAHG